MFASRVENALLSDRLDAEHFRPDLLHLEREVTRSGLRRSALEELRERDATITYGIVQPGEFVAEGAGVRLVRCTDLGDMSVDTANLKWVAAEIDRPYGRSRVKRGDVLIGIAGSVGIVGIVPEGMEPANLNQSVARVRCRTLETGQWAATFLSSKYGQGILARRAVGAVQQHLNLVDLPDVPVPMPHEQVVGYIGSKVRQAEALREWARVLGCEARDHFANLHSYTPERRLGSWRQAVRDLDDERLDATFYAPPAVDLHRALTTAEATPASDHAELIKVNDFDANRSISYFEIGGIDITTGCAWPTTVAAGEAPSRAQRSVAAWDILVGTVRPERKNVGIVPPSARGQLVATSGVAVLRAKSPAHAAYLWTYLRSDAATEQLMRWNTGAAYPAIEDEVALRVLVPPSDDAEATRLGARWRLVPRLYASAKELVAAARLLVEALIERKVTEAELIEAGKDAEADRALLARLAEDGLDGTGAPLFSDLDGLADLIAEAATDR